MEERIEKLEKLVGDLSRKIDKIEEEKINKTYQSPDAKIFDNFFNEFIVEQKDKRISTSDLFKKLNAYAANSNIVFNKFDVSKYVKLRGYERKKVGGSTYYYNIAYRNE